MGLSSTAKDKGKITSPASDNGTTTNRMFRRILGERSETTFRKTSKSPPRRESRSPINSPKMSPPKKQNEVISMDDLTMSCINELTAEAFYNTRVLKRSYCALLSYRLSNLHKRFLKNLSTRMFHQYGIKSAFKQLMVNVISKNKLRCANKLARMQRSS